jgi:RND family efflux transporter MFP subunit
MKSKKVWISLLIILALAGMGFFFHTSLLALIGQQTNAQASAANQAESTVAIRPASNQVSAAGNIDLAAASQQALVLQVTGIITHVAVQVGDTVKPGDLLVVLDSTDLERAVQQAQLNVASSQAALDKLAQPAKPTDVAAAQAGLTAAQKDLADLQAPDATQLAAAKTALAAAQAKYQDLKNGPSEAQKTQLAAEFHKAAVTLAQAQEAYNKIAYSSDVGMTQQAMDLQNATIDYDTTKAAYDVATQPTQTNLQSAINGVATAQSQLKALQQPTEAQLADAEAKVASAKATLADLVSGPTEPDWRTAELAVEQVKLALAQAQTNLDRAQLRSPITGTVLAVNVELGQQAPAGLNAITLADLTALELTINVAEVDIPKVQVGQPAQITLDALPGQTFNGVVSRIAPASTSQSGVVNYPVTIRLNNIDGAGVRPGMTAVATLVGNTAKTEWLVPTNALVEFEGEITVVVVRGEQHLRVKVTPGAPQGEWTLVQSAELHAGDQVVGSVTLHLNQQNSPNNRPRGLLGGGPPPGGGRPND